jgi:peptide deformylase
MAILPILQTPHPVLKQKALPVDIIDAKIQKIIDDMVETMIDAIGIGLAANQVGILKRIAVFDFNENGEEGVLHMVNPEITYFSSDLISTLEGCLSIPEEQMEFSRPREIEVKYLDYHSKEKTLRAEGTVARAIQHEIDHLNGILALDHISPLKRDIIMRRLKKHTAKKA